MAPNPDQRPRVPDEDGHYDVTDDADTGDYYHGPEQDERDYDAHYGPYR